MELGAFCVKYSENMDPIFPVFEKNNIALCFCSSDKYAPYCGVTIQSILENSSKEFNYDVLIMEHDITDRNKFLLLKLIKNYDNVSIRFVNMKSCVDTIKVNTWAHFSIVACFKLFLMSNAFSEYEKIITLDTDLIVTKDIATLFNYDISPYYLGAVDDIIMKMHVQNEKMTSGFAPYMPVKQYICEYLNFGSYDKYYNTGVAILNLKKCREEGLFQEAFYKLKTKGYTYQEQDTLNELCAGHILELGLQWNVVGTEQIKRICDTLDQDIVLQYKHALQDPYIVHFAGGLKPWIHNNIPFSDLFFKYAKHTPWYESILVNMSLNYIKYVQNNILSVVRNERTLKFKVRKILERILPKNTRRRKLFSHLFPRGKGIREFLRRKYESLMNGSYSGAIEKFSRKINLYWKYSAYVRNLKRPLKTHSVLLDSKNGSDLAGNIFRIIEELSTHQYKEFQLYLTYTKPQKEKISSILRHYGLQKVNLVEWKSTKYFCLLARSKYVITDLYMPSEYLKRSDQILLSTAHGTPIKVMGRDCHTETQGHLQRTHTLANYQTFPSNYMKEKLFWGFMEDQLFEGHALKSGYARNTVFFDKERRRKVRNELHFTGKTVYAYLPTFRGIAGHFRLTEQANDIIEMCEKLDKKMTDQQVLLVKLHNFSNMQLDLSMFSHIQSFPADYEVYDVLNATDGLISDYSSVIFDYANTKNKIILYQYDLNEYMHERGVYFQWNELPFPVVTTIDELFHEMTTEKRYNDKYVLERFCTYDNIYATKDICQTVFGGSKSCAEFPSTRNGKKNILIYAGSFDLRSPTTFFAQEYFKRLDLQKNNYFLYFYEYDLFNKAFMLEYLPADMQYISFLSYPEYTLLEKCKLNSAKKKNDYRRLYSTFKREYKKCLGNFKIDVYIDLLGRNPIVAEIAKNIPGKKVIMLQENSGISEECYKEYDTILSYSGYNNPIHNHKIMYLEEGYSPSILDTNASKIEEICNS